MSDKYLQDEKRQFINAIGTELAWGWSPAVDFTEIMERQQKCERDDDTDVVQNEMIAPLGGEKEEERNLTEAKKDKGSELDIDAMISAIQRRTIEEKKDEDGDNTVRVLLCGACDIRHIFRTLSSLRVKSSNSALESSSSPVYHFFIYEPNLRIHCRYLFFLQWLLDSMFSLDELEERVLMFLDAFGNALTRDTTSAQIRSVSQRLLAALRNGDGELAKLISFTEMKSKERDFIEEQILHWVRDTSEGKVEESWSSRLRQEMAERYDNRDNIIDWDFNFHLCEYTNLIKFAEYRTWRNSGVAFDATHINPRRGFSYNYLVPNKTLCHFNAKGVGRFLGDVKNGPFFAFGAQTANTSIRAKTIDGTCKYGNGVVSMHNVRAWLYGLLTGQLWEWGDHAFAWDDAANYNYLPPGTPKDVAHQATLPKTRFHFVGLDFVRFLQRIRERRSKRFDFAFVGVSCTQFMSSEFFEVAMKKDAVVVAETAKFVVDAHDEAKSAFVNKIRELAKAANWEQNNALTDLLHADQPESPKVDLASSNVKAQKMSLERHQMPYQVALTRCT